MDIINTVWQYIYKYYINGIIYDMSYNPVDTLTYAILLGISLFGVLKLLEKLEVDIDTRFMIAVTPYFLRAHLCACLRIQKPLRRRLNISL
jgi:uncharacterized membrane protein